MSNGIIKIGIFIVVISIVIYVIKNLNDVKKIFEKIKEKKYFKIIKQFLIAIFIIFILIIMGKKIINIKDGIKSYKDSKVFKESNLKFDNMIIDEMKFYNKAISDEYKNQNPSEPYIPENFEYVEGEWNTGFVIQDQNKNQYVWVPCTNKDNTDVTKLERTNYSKIALISKDICVNDEYENFIKSSLENGGFYISRFEIGKENNLPVSKSGKEVYSGLNKKEIIQVINNMYNDKSINCELINGYAYDTTLNWIMKNNVVEIDDVDVKNEEKIYTGRKKYNNIYDFIDNIMEMTLENSYDTIIIRGFPYKINDETKKITSKIGFRIENFDRFSILKDEKDFTDNCILGFRTVLYKKDEIQNEK